MTFNEKVKRDPLKKKKYSNYPKRKKEKEKEVQDLPLDIRL